jgi:hypothetical protein
MVAPAVHAARTVVVFVVNEPPPPQPGSWIHDSTGLGDPDRVTVVAWPQNRPQAVPAAASAYAGADAAARTITLVTKSSAARRTTLTNPFSVKYLGVRWGAASQEPTRHRHSSVCCAVTGPLPPDSGTACLPGQAVTS